MTTLLTAPPAPDLAAAHRRRRPSWPLVSLLVGTAVLYLWDLGGNGWANSYYAEAVQAGASSWKAMLFGSLDAGNAITVDKPAAFLWPMELSARLFGFNAWSMLVPQALMGVASVALVHAAVRRTTGSEVWGLLAGFVLAVTPVAVLMFRFNNPDAMLVLLLTGAAYAVVRALQTASGRWLALAGFLVGTGFITKMGQALLVVPALAVTYLLAAPTGFGIRVRQLLVAGAALVAGAGWWIALVTLYPGSTPWIGGSTDGSVLQLAFGYNGLGRLFGNSAGNGGPGGGMGGGTSFGGATGLGRLFRGQFATEVSWLLPTALLALALGLYVGRGAPRTDLRRAALVLFGGSLLTTVLVFSEMKGVIHPYYAIALAPLIAGVLAVTGSLLWEQRGTWTARLSAAVLLETTVLWDVHLLAAWQPAVKALVVLASVVAVTALLWGDRVRQVATVGLVAAAVAALGGSTAYAVSTASHSHSGSLPASGPVTQGRGGPGADAGADAQLVALLRTTTTTWAAATSGAGSAAPLQLASGKAVLALGGFNGGDPAPTLAQFQAWVAEGRISFYVTGGGMSRGPGGQGGSSGIASWVASAYSATTVGGATVYDLRTGR